MVLSMPKDAAYDLYLESVLIICRGIVLKRSLKGNPRGRSDPRHLSSFQNRPASIVKSVLSDLSKAIPRSSSLKLLCPINKNPV